MPTIKKKPLQIDAEVSEYARVIEETGLKFQCNKCKLAVNMQHLHVANIRSNRSPKEQRKTALAIAKLIEKYEKLEHDYDCPRGKEEEEEKKLAATRPDYEDKQ